MKLITAIIQPSKLDQVHEALAAAGIKGMNWFLVLQPMKIVIWYW